MPVRPSKLTTDPDRACAEPRSTMAFAAIGDHWRLPARFFARLCAANGSLLRS